MPESLNTQLADALLRRHLQLRRVETSMRRDVWEQLATLEAEILAALKVADPTDLALLARRQREIDALMDEEITPLVTTRYGRLVTGITVLLVALAQEEALRMPGLINGVAESPVVEELPSARTLRRAVTETLIPTATHSTDLSATGEEWWRRQGVSLTQRIGDQLMVSVSLAEPLTQAVARIRGTSAQGFEDGVMARARQDAARLLTTQVTNAVGEAHVAVAEANAARMILIHVSTIDSRTTSICMGRHGLRYTADTHEPIGHTIPYLGGVPYHIGCRSDILPGLEDGGPIPQEDLSAWLRRQGPAFQDEALGPKRAQLFREGKIRSPRDLLDAATGRPLTLEELR